MSVLDNHQLGLFATSAAERIEDPRYLQDQLITYLGNKRSLLPFLGKAVRHVQDRLGNRPLAAADLFAGTGVVARFLKQFCSSLTVNDLEAYSELTNRCYLTNQNDVDWIAIKDSFEWLKKYVPENESPGFISDLYAPSDEKDIQETDRVFYTRRNAVYLDSARQAIDLLPSDIRHFFLAPLLAAASVHANTSGVFKGFYKNADGIGQYGGNGRDALSRILRDINVAVPILSRFDCESQTVCGDANTVVDTMEEVDLAYLDPPYNQHPYGSNYFMLNLLAEYVRPVAISRVSGIPTDWNRSRYNQRADAADALFSLVERCPAKFVLISYNCEGFIPQDQFLDNLSKFGKLTTFETAYNTFRGSRNLRDRSIHVTEFLYLLEK